MEDAISDRRTVLQLSGVLLSAGIAGCADLVGGDEQGVQDTDGDGVIDSEDYAPRDPEVQEKDDLRNEECECPDGTDQPKATVTDGFEDGTVSNWTPAAELSSTFEASQERTFSGSWAAKFSEGNSNDNPVWERVGDVVKPEKVETAQALENGEIYSDSFTEWRSNETTVLRLNYNWSNNFLSVNGSGSNPGDIEDGAVVAELPWSSSDDFFHVVLDGIDWNDHIVGEVRVNGTATATNVPFFNEADGIDRATVFIGGNGGNVIFIDDTTVPTG